MSVNVLIILDCRKVKKNGKFSVKLRVYAQKTTMYYPTIFDLTKEDFEKLKARRVSDELTKIKESLNSLELAARLAAKDAYLFTFQEFERDFVIQQPCLKHKAPKDLPDGSDAPFDFRPYLSKFPILQSTFDPGTVGHGYLSYIKRLIQEGRLGTAVTYHCSYTSLKKFKWCNRFNDVTPSHLMQYENWLRETGKSKTTIGMYIRPLRCIFNEAIIEGYIRKERCYPFGRRKYQIPTGKNIKKALTAEEIKKLYYYQCNPDLPNEQKARDFWFFSYFGNGINIKDLVALKFKNIRDGFIFYERIKTATTMRSDPKTIAIPINEDMKVIIDRWGNRDQHPNNYIFTVLDGTENNLLRYKLSQQFISLINKRMKGIAKNLEIDKPVTTYVARHTFSTVLKRSGASTEYIQEALGHVDPKTTQSYLDSFEMEVKKEYAGKLLGFKD
jgi:integrase/recombinase XerD